MAHTLLMMSVFVFFLHSIVFLCIDFPVGVATTPSILRNETDWLALLSFKGLISHDPQQVMSSWNDSIHFCEWQGVTCSRRHQRVLMLNLMSKGLMGFISPSIGNLSFLTRINLENNSFQGAIPQEVGRLFRLKEFNMSNNSFVGEIPSNLSYCSSLKILLLGYNMLEGNIPTELGSLTKLILLYLHVNNLTGSIPYSFGNLSSLETLSLARNNVQGSIPDTLRGMKSLKFLGLGSNMLSGMIPPSLYNLSTLEIFTIPDNQVIGSLPLEIGLTLPNLRKFFIGGNRLSGSIPLSIFNVSMLDTIDIFGNNFNGEVPINVGNLKVLQYLGLGSNNLGNEKASDLNFLNSLTNCSYLQMLDVFHNNFGGKLPNSIANLSNQLNYLYLGENQIFGSIPSEIGNLANLIVLTMDFNFFTGSIPKGIGLLQKLQGFTLGGNRFSGQIPSSIGNMSQLYQLDLSDNILEGKIVSDIGKCQFLQGLDLSKNNLNDTIPKQIIGLAIQLTSINLSHNSLIGSLPVEVGNLNNLEQLDVSENKLIGEIPSSLGSCLGLEHLYLQGNFFQGPIPSQLSSLKGIQNIDLSRNNLSAQIPKFLEDLSFLKSLNLSFNDLEGEIPTKGVFQNASAFSIVGNSKLCGGIPELQLHACPIKKSMKRGAFPTFKVAISVILSSIAFASFLVFYLRRKPRMKPSSTLHIGENYRRISYNALNKATEGFATTNLIGVGSFGSVYRGVLHQDETYVAVKVFKLMERGALKGFITECEALRKVRHRNLLKILTVCSSVDSEGNDFKALIFEFMPNGSLENWLHPRSDDRHLSRNLNLSQRLNIAIDVASALDYLHNHCQIPIIHCDLKSSNVLLDNDMTAVVGDFGLAKFLTMSGNTSITNDNGSISIKGTIGYIPPEYGMGANASTQGDVYSYGILLLEMFTGKRPTDKIFKDGLCLRRFCEMALTERVMEIVDPLLLLEEDHNETIIDFETQRHKMRECLISIIRVGVACSAESLNERIDINDVIMELHIIMEVFLRAGINGQRQNTP